MNCCAQRHVSRFEGILKRPNFTSAYHKKSLEQVQNVFKDFGDLYVKINRKPNGQPGATVLKAKTNPWSGYWYPVYDKVLYEGENSPLAKYDRLVRSLGRKSNVAEQEAKRYQGYHADAWEGYCDGWSVASVLNPEPTKSKLVNGIRFSITDQKALLTFSHVQWDSKQYGLSYMGNWETDGTYQDIRPEAFHKIITHTLGEEGRSVVVDSAAGPEVWNKPLYRYRWIVKPDPKLDYAYLVHAFVGLINQRNQETDQPTKAKDVITPDYTFRLYLDKSVRKGDAYKVVAGQWTERSWIDHPDNVTYPLKTSKKMSHNKDFDKNKDIYRKYFLQK